MEYFRDALLAEVSDHVVDGERVCVEVPLDLLGLLLDEAHEEL